MHKNQRGKFQKKSDVDKNDLRNVSKMWKVLTFLWKSDIMNPWRRKAAAEYGITEVADGSNVDDTGDYRPGMRAMKELGIVSPLKESGLTKNDIRTLSKEADLPTWDKPAAACLASRFVYGEKITTEGLIRVANAEKFIRDMGFRGIRVRVHGDIARIEAAPDDIELLTYGRTRKEISDELKRLGFKYVTIDIDGYRTGSMNEVLNIKEGSSNE